MACSQIDDNSFPVSMQIEATADNTKTEQRLCEQCEQEKDIKAFCVECQEYLCEECTVYHCRPSRMRHHRLLKENEMPRKKAIISGNCVKHSDEVNKFYCESHNECCCPVCAITVHKKCELKALSDITKNYLTSEEYDDSKKNLIIVDKLVRNQIEKIEKRLELGNKSVNAALEELSKHRNEINKHFDQLEKELKTEALNVQVENSYKMNTLSTSCKDMLTKITEMKDDLSVLEDTKQEKLLFAAVRANKKPTEQLKDSIEKMEADTVVRQVKLCKNRISNSMTIRKDLLGYLQVFVGVEERIGDEVDGRKEENREKEIYARKVKEVEVKQKEANEKDDEMKNATGEQYGSCNNCEAGNTHFNCQFYTDFGVVPKLLKILAKYCALLEHCKSKISILSDDIKPTNTNIIFSTCPWDMDKVAENSLAVTFPQEKKIKFLYVDENKIEEENEITTPGFCRCIAVVGNTFIVTFSEPAEIKQIDQLGKVLKSFMSKDDGTILFQTPSSLAVADRNIFVTDPNMRTITRMNLVDKKYTRRTFKSFKPSYICNSNEELFVSSCGEQRPAKMSCDLEIKKMKKGSDSEDDEMITVADYRIITNDITYLSSFILHTDDDFGDDDDDDDDDDYDDDDDENDDDNDDKEDEDDNDDTNNVEKSSDDDDDDEENDDDNDDKEDEDDNDDTNNVEKSSDNL